MSVLFSLITPRWNKYMTYGTIGIVVGIVLTPVLIGLPIIGLGFGLFSIGVMVSIVEKFPRGKWLIAEYEKMFSSMFSFVRSIIQEALR